MMFAVALSALLSIKDAAKTDCSAQRSVMYAVQAVDVLQSSAHFAHGSYESNWWSRRFMRGKYPQSTAGLVASIVTWDAIGMFLTRRSTALRCAFEVRQIVEQLGSIEQSR